MPQKRSDLTNTVTGTRKIKWYYERGKLRKKKKNNNSGILKPVQASESAELSVTHGAVLEI